MIQEDYIYEHGNYNNPEITIKNVTTDHVGTTDSGNL